MEGTVSQNAGRKTYPIRCNNPEEYRLSSIRRKRLKTCKVVRILPTMRGI